MDMRYVERIRQTDFYQLVFLQQKVIDCLRNDVANCAEQTVLVLDDVSDYDNLERILSAAALLHQRPYIIAVFSSGLIKGNALHHLLFNHQVRYCFV